MRHYIEGDSITVNHCGEDLSASTTGKVVFADKEHLIVHFEFCNPFAASGFNRRGLSEEEIVKLNVDLESFKKNEYDIFVDMKVPHTYLSKDICSLEEKWAPAWKEEMFWDNLVLDEPINGYTIVEKDGKYNFIYEATDEYYSDVWFDRVINWTQRGTRKYTVVEYQGDCYKIFGEELHFIGKEDKTTILISGLYPRARYRDFKKIFGAKVRTLDDIILKTVCKIDNKWYLAASLREPWTPKWRDIYYKRDKEATVKMDRQWWYNMLTTFASAELCIGQSNGKYGFFPLMSEIGMQDGDYYAEEYPFIYDEYKIYESDTVHQETYIDNAYSYIAVKEDDKWGLLKITGMPTMRLEQVAESKYPDLETMFSRLGIEVPKNHEEPYLHEESDE